MNLKHLAYATWVKIEVEGDGYGKCVQAVDAMHETFPELEKRFGFFFASAPWGRRHHWWLRTPDGQIVDPTGKQHPNGQIFPESDAGYEDLTDLDPEELRSKVPTGVCLDCGGPVYNGETFCNSSCAAATASYMKMVIKEDGRWHNV